MSGGFPDDTALDAIASQVRSLAALGGDEIAALLEEARATPASSAKAALVEQQLAVVLDAVLARRSAGVDVLDLYQEGSIAATTAVTEYVDREGAPAGLRPYVARVVDTFLDAVVKREVAQRLADSLLLERVKVLETAEVGLRRQLDRPATVLELAAALDWTPEEVETVSAVLHRAQAEHDAEILAFLDDLEDVEGDGADRH